jgi:predicted flap endonuclease-1-like 5' DNA nuclease
MNDSQMTSATGSSLLPDSTTMFTTMHLTVMAIFAVVVIIGILWGIRLSRRRHEANDEIARDNAAIVSDRADASPAPEQPAAQQPPPEQTAPERPTPPPLADSPVVGTPAPAPEPIADAPIAAADLASPDLASPDVASPDLASTNPTDESAIPLTMLKGLGPKVAARLAELGMTDARQFAALNDADAVALDAQLGPFSGRMTRDRWLEQARLLAAGDKPGYEAIFGKL